MSGHTPPRAGVAVKTHREPGSGAGLRRAERVRFGAGQAPGTASVMSVHPEWYSDESGRLRMPIGLRQITLHDSGTRP
jgi:hypothetical protein